MLLDILGKKPSGKRLQRIKNSPHYKNGQFQNLSKTATLAEGYSMANEIYKQVFKKFPDRYPSKRIPSVKTDLHALPKDKNVVIWFGHSSYFLQTEGKSFLMDPVLSGNASPIPSSVTAFDGTDIYKPADFPKIDYLLISHDHYDHLDYKTVVAIKDKVGCVICGLGVGAHFESWGYDPKQIIETDWYDRIKADNNITLHTTPARHFSGRGLKRNNTLWQSYVLETAKRKIFLGGDSGYDSHFKEIGDKYGPFDLAILENGQYNEAWHHIHMLPHEGIQAARDLRAKNVLPVHSSKFVLARHPWYDPLRTYSKLSAQEDFHLLTPKIGQMLYLDNMEQSFQHWWEEIM